MMFAPLSSQAQTVSHGLRGLLLRVRPYKDAPPLSLTAEGGMHNKCKKNVRLDAIRIGAGDSNDFVLLDDGIADNHASIAVSYSLLGPLAAVTALAPGLEVEGTTLQEGETSSHLRLPVRIGLADEIFVHLGKRESASKQLGPGERFLRRLTTTMALLGVATIGLVVWDKFFAEKLVLVPAASVLAEEEGPAALGLETFNSKLAEFDLASILQVRESEDGLIMVRGRLTPDQMKVWARFAEWYDTVSFSRPMVVELDSTTQLPVIPPVSIVRLSEPKEIILKTGESIRVDNSFAEDWTVAAIERDHIVIARGPDREKLVFAGSSQ